MYKKEYRQCSLSASTLWSLCENPLRNVIPSGARNLALSISGALRDSSSPTAPRNDTQTEFSHRPLGGPCPKSCSSGSWLLTSDFCGRIQVAGLALFFALALVGVAKGASFQPRVHIPDSVQVEGETVRLADLLPSDAPAELREIGAQIILGNSPLAASQRAMSKGQLKDQLREFPSVMQSLDLPERVLITCKRRRLSAAEIMGAIEIFKAKEGLHGPVAQACFPRSAARSSSKPEAAGVSLHAPVFVTKPDPGLEVKKVEFDRVQRKTRYLLWASKEPQVLPFYVTAEELPRAAWTASFPQGGEGRNTTNSRSSAVLVAVGKPAKLVVETAALRMTVLVTPLQSGARGQLIRVRNQDTQRVFEAEVVGVNLLQARLGEE